MKSLIPVAPTQTRRTPISIGICAHNEQETIEALINSILKQSLPSSMYLKELLIISSGSTDDTDQIITQLAKHHTCITPIIKPKREGKAQAVNTFIKKAKSRYLVLSSADLLLEKNCLNMLLTELQQRKVGLTAPQIKPSNDNGDLVSFAFQLQWELHHKINLQFPNRPKVGELVAFKKIFKRIISSSAVDEANIEPLIHLQDYSIEYCPEAIVYNRGPETILDFLRQRRRIYAGHTSLRNEYGYTVVTYSNTRVFGVLLANMTWEWDYFVKLLGVIFLEAVARLSGLLDYYLQLRTHTIWKTAHTTKKRITTAKDTNVSNQAKTVLKANPR